MKTVISEHRSGQSVVSSEIITEICSLFTRLDIYLKKYSIKDFRNRLHLELKKLGWSDNVPLAKGSKINITSERDEVGLCIQTGNVGRIYADLLKLQAMYMKGTIKAGVIIIPTSTEAKTFGGNVASLERLERELPIFYQVITMPLVVIGFYE